MKKKLTSGEWLGVGLTIFYVIIAFVSALGMEGSHTAMNKNNLFAGIAELLNMPNTPSYSGIWILLIFILVFLIVFAFLYIFIRRHFLKTNQNPYSVKAFAFYTLAFALCFGLSIGFGILFQLGDKGLSIEQDDGSILKYGGIENLDETFGFVFSSLLLGLLIFAFLVCFIWALIGVINFCLRKKPKALQDDRDDEVDEKNEESKKEEENKGDLSSSFSDVDSLTSKTPLFINGNGNVGEGGNALGTSKELAKKEEVFKNLVSIDNQGLGFNANANQESDISLKDLVTNLQGYLANVEHLYYDKRELAQFIAGLNASKFIILEGISGTGKSSLPRYFAKFIGEEAFFEAIQVTYKDKSDLLGFYNELTGRYNETLFLDNLYRASYETSRLNLVVLDEMNISRIEYYFADFLSVMEFPENDRKISLMLLPDDYDAPENLEKGQLIISPNTYFIGTANKDDSTFTITDKVIDRAIVIDFEDTQKEVHYEGEFNPISLSYSRLAELFVEAKEAYKFKPSDKAKFLKVLEFMSSELDITIGNRIIRQLDDMVPIYLAMEINYEECLDNVFANKILRKLESRYDSSLRNGLNKLNKLLDELYGRDSFTYSRTIINKYLRRAI